MSLISEELDYELKYKICMKGGQVEISLWLQIFWEPLIYTTETWHLCKIIVYKIIPKQQNIFFRLLDIVIPQNIPLDSWRRDSVSVKSFDSSASFWCLDTLRKQLWNQKD